MNIILFSESDYITSTQIRLCDRRLHHIQGICRSNVGDTLKVGLINGLLGKAIITRLDETCIELDVELTQAPPKPSSITLIIGMIRPKAFRRVIECATTLGIKNIYITGSSRVEKSFWQSPEASQESIMRHCLYGCEQAGDTILPTIHLKRRFKFFIEDDIPNLIKDTRAIVAHPYGSESCPCNVNQPITLAIGPEGGFIEREIDLFISAGFTAVTCGSRILRTEHALPAVVGRLASYS